MPQIWEQRRPTRRQLSFDLACAGALALVLGGLYLRASTGEFLLVVVFAAALAVRRLSVGLMMALGLTAAIMQFMTPQWMPRVALVDFAYAALFFMIGADPRAAVRRLGIILGGLGLAALPFWTILVPDGPAGADPRLVAATAVTAMAGLVCGGGWIAGYLRLQRRRSIQAELDAQVDRVERLRLADRYEHESQRSRIAADMHDTVAHSWAVVAAQADGARYAMRDNPAATEQALEVIAETARSTIADVRTILAELRDVEAEPPRSGDDRHERLMQRMRSTGMQIQHRRVGGPDQASLLTLTAHRLLGESLTNALKHGDLRVPVQVFEDWSAGYRLRVVNAVGTPGQGTGHGIVGMIERANIAGGHLESRRLSREWVVDASIPTPSRVNAARKVDLKESARS
ncbi:sensor histidine kinase [Leekyejoonella antrihumi]|nr:histidine kinase [Leekyejoonella antrihumi]